METIFVKPKKNLLVRSPKTKTPIPEKGCNVPWVGAEGRYWRRRVRDGDVEIPESIKKENTEFIENTEDIVGKFSKGGK